MNWRATQETRAWRSLQHKATVPAIVFHKKTLPLLTPLSSGKEVGYCIIPMSALSRQEGADRTPSCSWFGAFAQDRRVACVILGRTVGEFQVGVSSWWVSLDQEVHTPLGECYIVAGAPFGVFTNSQDILATALSTFRQVAEPQAFPVLTMRLWVDITAQARPPWPQPYFRGLDHLVYAGFDRENSLLLDLRRRRAIGRFSPSMARDEDYWQRIVVPNLVGLASETLGITALHCACVERDGQGLLLAGGSGAGKSTLSLAMTQSGFAFLSDDWTYFSPANGRLLAWGLATPVKLLPDTVEYFPELRSREPGVAANGERCYEVDPELVFGVRRSLHCEPRWLIFLERQESPGYSFSKVPAHEAAARLESDLEDLPSELSRVREIQRETILSLVGRECWLLRHGEKPQDIAQALARFWAGPDVGEVQHTIMPENTAPFARTGPDVIRRFTPTPLVAALCAAGCTIRLETNSRRILEQAIKALNRSGWTPSNHEQFLWRLVSDDDAGLCPPWPDFSTLAVDSLCLVNIGQRSFLAVDADTRCAVGFLADGLVKDDKGFEELFLAKLLSLTAAALSVPSGLQR